METIRTTRGTWNVDTKNIIGNGAYGIVYRGTDEKGKEIAAKRIDTKEKKGLSEKIKALDKLMELDHQNIVKVHDIHEDQGIVWIIMELCEHGDLTTFFKNNKLAEEDLFSIMKQIASGIAYLHEHNIIHRDIKPENILVANASKLQVKLTDFDISKFFDEYFGTSAMSTNVGTLAFKAPEFFQRQPDGTLSYHRTVDVYACGLTFLALYQAQGKKKKLLPQIETARDNSELHTPSIRQLIAERIKYKVPDLNVVVTNSSSLGSADSTFEFSTTTEIKQIILNMTKADPKERWSAAQVVEALQSVDNTVMEGHPKQTELTEDMAATEMKRIVHKQKVLKLKANRTVLWKAGTFHANTMCAVGDQLLVQGADMEGKVYIRVFNRSDGRFIREIKSQCDHASSFNELSNRFTDSRYILQACSYCNKIRSYDIRSGEVETIHTSSFRAICRGLTTLC